MHIWVIEYFQNTTDRWIVESGNYLTRNRARKELQEIRLSYGPEFKFRIRKYVREELFKAFSEKLWEDWNKRDAWGFHVDQKKELKELLKK